MATNKETKEVIEKMKLVVLDMFRSAADLDQWIQQLELELNKEDNDPTFNKIYVNTIHSYREKVKHDKRWNSIGSMEDSLWEMLKIELQKDGEEEQES